MVTALCCPARRDLNLLERRDALAERRCDTGRGVCFFGEQPKLREIFAADCRDRVVHPVPVSYREKIRGRVFSHDADACRKGKGGPATVARQVLNRQAAAKGRRRHGTSATTS
ncbi:MAG: hypothetical protein EXR83_14485 [Gammaproteobacteria bacterium]|nr:hypothetical protein [Gammaproteobacteria bacterium]